MFVEHEFVVGLSDINQLNELSNTFFLRYLEDVAAFHSEIAGYGITDMKKTRKSWVLLSWRVEIKNRPLVNDTLKIKTWSRLIDKFYAFRDFEIKNQYDEVIAIASSKWIFVDIDKAKLVKVTDDVIEAYKQEDYGVFEEIDLPKLFEPNSYISEINFKITRNMIDINKHLHNIYYLDIAKEVLPESVAFSNELNCFDVMYKKEIKLGENVKAFYTKQDDYHFVVIKNQEETVTHAIIRLKENV